MSAAASAPARVRRGRSRIQDLVGAVLAGADTDELLDLLLRTARHDLAARSALLIMPLGGDEGWGVEIVEGADARDLLGQEVAPYSAVGAALLASDVDALESRGDLAILDSGDGTPVGGTSGSALPPAEALISIVDAGDGMGLLVALRCRGVAEEAGSADPGPFTETDRERLDALAGVVGLALRMPDLGSASEVDDERSRIARDLHDLAIQELFAVGMGLEGLTQALSSTGEPPTNARIRSTVASSVQGVENAVAQIREIVQSLRRERSEATLSERLRHEVGLATSGLGFVPTLRLSPSAPELDRDLPPEIAEDVVAVVRECLANAARHAHASAVAASVSMFSEGVDRVVQVNVSDNGKGIDPSVRRRSGLANMSSRARRHSGWVDAINLEPGTMISWRVTLPPQ
ncbi:sensor histidine kinase [Brachybacterium sp. DNPG3]